MHSFLLSKIIIPIQITFIALYLLCVPTGAECIQSYLPIPIFILTLIELLLLFPAAKKGEDESTSRERLRRQILRDPVLYFGLAALIFIIIQSLNGPRELVYNKALRLWAYESNGKLSSLPSALDKILSIHSAFWIAITTSVLITIRNGLSKNGKILLLKLLAFSSSAFALYCLVRYANTAKASTIADFTFFASPIEAGIFFYMTNCLTLGLIFYEMRLSDRSKYILKLLIPAFVLTFTASMYSLSPIIITTHLITLSLIIIYTFISFIVNPSGELRLTSIATFALLIGIFAFFHYVAYPQNKLHGCTETILSGKWQSNIDAAESNLKNKIAWRIFADNSVSGIGTWCYSEEYGGMAHYIRADEWTLLKDSENRHYYVGNDTAQSFAEQGVVGTTLTALPFIYIILISLIQIVMLARNGTSKKLGLFARKSKDTEKLNIFNVIPVHLFSMYLAAIGAYIISFYASALRNPANILIWTVLIASAATLLLKPAKSVSKK